MKFCKNLQRVVEISDPEWAPYWINYKYLKKLIKGIVSSSSTSAPLGGDKSDNVSSKKQNESTIEVVLDEDSSPPESSPNLGRAGDTSDAGPPEAGTEEAGASLPRDHQSQGSETFENQPRPSGMVMLVQLDKSPAERAFFKLLHTEVKKSMHFFEQAQKEYIIREERVRMGMDIIKSDLSDTSSAEERWSRCAQSIFRLYRELLLLETFAIMTYCGFSKILKKHDKNTGFNTRIAFMDKIVNQANFVNYPLLLKMINRCEKLYEEVSNRLHQEGKNKLQEDQRLFIHMIHRLNAQVAGGSDDEGPSNAAASAEPGAKTKAPDNAAMLVGLPSRTGTSSHQESWKAQTLKELVAENHRAQDEDSDSDADDVKPKAIVNENTNTTPSKVSRKRGPSSDDDLASRKEKQRRK